ncbi:MAG TPA: ribonuclease HIII [Elusimicrobiota bacterium]|nr:ribonuclease HIII [Elusimicrobiota bacterium]
MREQRPIAHGRQLVCEGDAEKATVNVYFGKQGVSVVLGGKEGELKRMLESVRNEVLTSFGRPADLRTGSSSAVPLPPPPWIGTDESGKGDFFGPLVAAGFYAGETEEKALRALGVKDSKLLSDKRIMEISDELLKGFDRKSFSVVELDPEPYNRLYQQFVTEGKNLNHLLAWGHARAIENILEQKECPTVIADKFGDEAFLRSKLLRGTRDRRIRLIQIPRAEQNLAVAAASILARRRLLEWSRSAERTWGQVFPKGASPAVEAAARQFVAKHGKENLRKVAKIHFKTAERVAP